MKRLVVAAGQPRCQPGDVAGNLDRMEPMVAQAAVDGARLVLFAEAGVTGYRKEFPCVTLGDDTCTKLGAMASRHGVVVAAGFMERSGAARHITHGVFLPNGRVIAQRKARPGPPERDMPDWRPGPDERTVFEVDGVRCAISICADTGIPDAWGRLARQGVQLHLIPTAGVGPRNWGYAEADLDDPAVWQAAAAKMQAMCLSTDGMRQCRTHRMAMVSCNQMADNGVDYFHPGHSMIIDRSGELVALIPGVCVFEHLRERCVSGTIHAN